MNIPLKVVLRTNVRLELLIKTLASAFVDDLIMASGRASGTAQCQRLIRPAGMTLAVSPRRG